MPESAVQLNVYMPNLTENGENKVADMMREYGFSISTTWEPAKSELEYQTAAFADTEENVEAIEELESALKGEFSVSGGTSIGLDESRQTTQDKPIKGAYQMTVERTSS
ncbi:hypothetical protein [Haloarcula sp. 1CSR25-25]|uniref:hypothetical protein n=1 Tax=Haloarcula sp. 1CSR25-25 TaxID=2862545 RepID=UPI0028938D53|nr:hypothetical protein [Haloarcula sp. 1CSR25-25]MDT3434656.1 hypothetical protein [Haloarcula sp. 1CSR25-25]